MLPFHTRERNLGSLTDWHGHWIHIHRHGLKLSCHFLNISRKTDVCILGHKWRWSLFSSSTSISLLPGTEQDYIFQYPSRLSLAIWKEASTNRSEKRVPLQQERYLRRRATFPLSSVSSVSSPVSQLNEVSMETLRDIKWNKPEL